jgi:hypothetical protein
MQKVAKVAKTANFAIFFQLLNKVEEISQPLLPYGQNGLG